MKPKNDLMSLREQFEFDTAWEIVEGSSEVDGIHILGRVKGPFFVVNGKSQNNRYYSEKLWMKAVTESSPAMESGFMLGTIGHDQELDDKALREGKGSHRITKLWIPENEKKINGNKMGFGEALILNTSSGRELNGYLRGGVKLGISSRAFGKYRGKKEGADIIDPDTFRLEGFDFVRLGGVKGAVPPLVEHSENINDDEEIMEVNEMETKALERITEDKIALQADLSKALESNDDLKGQLAIVNDKVKGLTEMLDEYKKLGTASELTKKLSESDSVATKMGEVDKELTELKKAMESYTELGNIEDVNKALEISKKMAESLKELGSVQEITEALDTLTKYVEFGSPEDIDEAFEKIKSLVDATSELGTPEEITEALKMLEGYVKLGSVDDINKAFELTDKIVESAKEERLKADIKELVDTLKVTEETAKDLLGKMSKEEAMTFTNKLKKDLGLKVSERYIKEETNEGEQRLDEGTPNTLSTESRAARLVETMGK